MDTKQQMREEYNAQHRNFPGLDWFTWQIAWAAALAGPTDAAQGWSAIPNTPPVEVMDWYGDQFSAPVLLRDGDEILPVVARWSFVDDGWVGAQFTEGPSPSDYESLNARAKEWLLLSFVAPAVPAAAADQPREPTARDCGCSNTMLYCSEDQGCRLGLNESCPAPRAAAQSNAPSACGPYKCEAAQHDGVLCSNDECDIATGARTAPFANCSFRHCDLLGQCREEGACHHPRRDALAEKLTCDTPEQMSAARKRICEAIDGAMAFGYLNLNEPPAAHWLAPWWTAGQSQRAAMNALRYLDHELTQYVDGMPADETSRKLRDAARDGLAGIDSSPLTATAGAKLARELEMLIAVTSQRSLTATEFSKARVVLHSIALIAAPPTLHNDSANVASAAGKGAA